MLQYLVLCTWYVRIVRSAAREDISTAGIFACVEIRHLQRLRTRNDHTTVAAVRDLVRRVLKRVFSTSTYNRKGGPHLRTTIHEEASNFPNKTGKWV